MVVDAWSQMQKAAHATKCLDQFVANADWSSMVHELMTRSRAERCQGYRDLQNFGQQMPADEQLMLPAGQGTWGHLSWNAQQASVDSCAMHLR